MSQIDATVVIAIPAREQAFPSTDEIEIRPPSDERQPILGFGEAWTFALEDDGWVHVQNCLLFPELTVIDGFDIVCLEPEDDDVPDDGEPDPVPSEWLIALADVARWRHW